MELKPGLQIDRFTLRYRLGRGGMAEVWAAEHNLLGSMVAVKLLTQRSTKIQRRLLQEGQVQAGMKHPNLLPVLDVVDSNGQLGLVLPLIEGPSVEQLLRDYRPTTAEVHALFRAIVLGVSHAHERGLIHRDLKPGNILLDIADGRVTPRVGDFGLVKLTHGDGLRTGSGVLLGTLHYAAPEQLLDAARVDLQADLWSLGVLLAELLTGQPLFQPSSLGELLEAQRTPPALTRCPPAFQPLLAQLLQPEPDERLADTLRLIAALDAIPVAPGDPLGPDGGLAAAAHRLWQARLSSRASIDVATSDQTIALSSIAEPPPRPRHNLPDEQNAFVGRSDALKRLEVLLQPRAAERLVSVVGTGGTGKTRLMLRFARRHLSAYPGGVWFCDLSEARSLEALTVVVGHALEVRLGRADAVAHLGHAIAGRGACLIILDNFEQLTEHAADTLGQWLQQCPEARFVATSRTVLGLLGETVLALSPLSESDAVALFRHRAADAKRDFNEQAHAPQVLQALVNGLDRLPLAIELAAARVRILSPDRILARLRDRFRLLSAPDRSDRQSTLRAVLDWSWGLLTLAEKEALAQLSVFEGGFSMEAAEAVLAFSPAAGGEDCWAMDVVQSLLQQSLIDTVSDTRFRLLVSVQDYAAARLRDPDSHPGSGPEGQRAAEARHGAHFARLNAPEVAPHRVRRELANLLAASRRAAARQDAAVSADTTLAAWSNLQHTGPYAMVAQLFTPALALSPDSGPLHRDYGVVCSILGEMQLAEEHLQEALRLCQASGQTLAEGLTRHRLGSLRLQQGQLDSAQRYFQEARTIFRTLGDARSEANVTGNLGNICWHRDDLAGAEEHYQAALVLHRQVGNRRNEGVIIGNLALLHKQRGHLEDAETCYQKALVILRQEGMRRTELHHLCNLAALLKEQGRAAEAEAHLNTALTLGRELGEPQITSVVYSMLGILRFEQDRVAEAEAYLNTALALVRKIGERFREANILFNLANCRRSRGDLSGAEERYGEACATYRAAGQQHKAAMSLNALGDLLREQGRLQEARAHLSAALALARACSAREHEMIAQGQLGYIDGLDGRYPEAKQALSESIAWLETSSQRSDLIIMLTLLAETELNAGALEAAAAALARASAVKSESSSPLFWWVRQGISRAHERLAVATS